MLFFFLIYAEIEINDNKLDDLKKKQNEVKKGITGKKETTAANTIKAEIEINDNKLDELKKKQNEIKKGITGKKETTAANTIKKAVDPTESRSCSSQYNSATIHISQDGCPTSNDTAASNIRETHYEINTMPNRPLNTACGGHDVFEPRNLRDPDLPPK